MKRFLFLLMTAMLFNAVDVFAQGVTGFVDWTKDVTEISKNNPSTLTVTEDIEPFANFAIEEMCTITLLADPVYGGEISGGGIYPCGIEVLISATPQHSCEFLYWVEGGEVITDNLVYSFTLMRDMTLTAHFYCNVGVETIETNAVNIFPNPASGEIRVTIAGQARNELQVTRIEVFDLMGRLVTTPSFGHPSKGGELVGDKFPSFGGAGVVNISHLPTGIYFLRITTETGVITRKVVKQ